MKLDKIKIIGTRHGEKIHETLMSREEMFFAKDYKKYLPNRPKESISFELHDITSDMANTIRR